jgi:hypothetical protein
MGQERSADGEIHVKSATTTSEVQCKTLKELNKFIRNKRRGMPTSNVAPLRDNALPQTAAGT